ncbi:hypothetical protein [Thermomonas alba]|uniref:hypothetical protein n=1 Tax=Thermomonas alba TaxID=2888525 RepID=UPI001F046C88|nr:hypothetical protein [Thermomonas alba]
MNATASYSSRPNAERRRLPRHPESTAFEPRRSSEREFGIGYGRSSGYARVRSYVSSQPALFRCR